ncbi:basic-leucine zipper transcription factor family protein [Perilla frutescens var. hirtella]|nr:basic-leucine zipper transcription factor family protein [Perilla frutescens var. frutescens]KAH6799927.1 basic-leucine zipper transcription factor family protein [Perilla frutescens var. hirtella]
MKMDNRIEVIENQLAQMQQNQTELARSMTENQKDFQNDFSKSIMEKVSAQIAAQFAVQLECLKKCANDQGARNEGQSEMRDRVRRNEEDQHKEIAETSSAADKGILQS